ncbi:MAG: hypothetical protein M3R62_00400, partial [Acidobacteriota bacterium]|nr:hypothetical protein [Acidobacteriota bacterium]
MHKALAMPAATLAALLLFGAPDGADARSRAAGKNTGASSKVQRSARGSKSPARVSGAHGRRKPAPAVLRGRKTRGRQRAEVATGVRPRTKRSAPATLSAHGRRGSGKRVIRQNPFGEVVLDRAELA